MRRRALPLACLALSGCQERRSEPAPSGTPPASATAPKTADATALPAVPPSPPPPLPADAGEHRGDARWAARIGGTMADAGRAVAIDPRGRVAVGGYFRDTIDLGGVVLQATDGTDGFVAVYEGDGRLVHAKAFGGRGDDNVTALAFDGEGALVVGGAFSYQLDFGDARLVSDGGDEGFVVKLDATGRRSWAKRIGGADVDAVYGVATSKAGDVYVTGEYAATAELGTERVTSAGQSDAFVIKYAADGAPRWGRRFGGEVADYGRAVRATADGGAIVLAEVSRVVDLGGGAQDGAGNRDVAVVSLDADGGYRWSTRFGGSNDELALGLAVDPVGSVALTGSFDSEIGFAGERHRSAGLADAFVAKLSPTGAPLWLRVFGSKEVDIGGGVASDAHGNLYAVGWFWYAIDFGKGPLTSAGRKDAYAVALAPDGKTLWARRFGAADNDFLQAVATDGDGRPVAVGTFHRTIDFGKGPLAAAGAPGAEIPLGDVAVVAFDR